MEAIMRTGHLHNNQISVSGHLQERRGIYHMTLGWTDKNGKRGRKSISTGLPVKGNKKRAEEMLRVTRKEHKELLTSMPEVADLLFADFMEMWLEVIKREIKLTTFGGYQLNVEKAIVPHFRTKGTWLRELSAATPSAFVVSWVMLFNFFAFMFISFFIRKSAICFLPFKIMCV
jgi:hypothetical protein